MINIRSKIIELRKEKGWSQAQLATAVKTSRNIIGKYERNYNSPSIEMALKIAKGFDISVHYLLNEGKHVYFYKKTLKCLEGIESIDQNTRNSLFSVIDTFLCDAKTRVAYT